MSDTVSQRFVDFGADERTGRDPGFWAKVSADLMPALSDPSAAATEAARVSRHEVERYFSTNDFSFVDVSADRERTASTYVGQLRETGGVTYMNLATLPSDSARANRAVTRLNATRRMVGCNHEALDRAHRRMWFSLVSLALVWGFAVGASLVAGRGIGAVAALFGTLAIFVLVATLYRLGGRQSG